MNIEKLKPWNWFNHEDDSTSQVPLSKKETSGELKQSSKALSTHQNQAVSSVLQLHQEMEQVFDDVWRSFGMPSVPRVKSPTSVFKRFFDNPVLGDYRAKLDIAGSDKEYEVSIDIPGLSEGDLQLTLNGNTLTVKGNKEEVNESKDKQYYRVERSVGAFSVPYRYLKMQIVMGLQPMLKTGY